MVFRRINDIGFFSIAVDVRFTGKGIVLLSAASLTCEIPESIKLFAVFICYGLGSDSGSSGNSKFTSLGATT